MAAEAMGYTYSEFKLLVGIPYWTDGDEDTQSSVIAMYRANSLLKAIEMS